MLIADISKTFGEFGPVPVEVFRAGHPPLEDLPQKKYVYCNKTSIWFY